MAAGPRVNLLFETVQSQPIPASNRPEELRRAAPRLKWWHGWGPLFFLPVAVFLLVPATSPPWALMWSLAIAIYGGCKWLTWRRTPVAGAPLWRHAAYLVAWPGLNPIPFLKPEVSVTFPKPRLWEWMFAVGKLALGVWLMFWVARWVPAEHPYVVGWIGMIGIVFVLHFGAFHCLSCFWRGVGIDARPLMNWPVAAVSVSEFWGFRWNTAFRDLTHRFLFRPLTSRFGPRSALFVGFIFSGVIHDLVISVPPRGGFGGPTLFFVLQGAAIFVERSMVGRRIGLGKGWRGWLFTACILFAPLAVFLHVPFVTRIVVPFMRDLGAI